jgi:hypothetical protein
LLCRVRFVLPDFKSDFEASEDVASSLDEESVAEVGLDEFDVETATIFGDSFIVVAGGSVVVAVPEGATVKPEGPGCEGGSFVAAEPVEAPLFRLPAT